MLAYLVVEIEKCDHQEGHKFIRTFPSAIGTSIRGYSWRCRGIQNSELSCINLGGGGGGFQVDESMTF